jgi:hypothetical protein
MFKLKHWLIVCHIYLRLAANLIFALAASFKEKYMCVYNRLKVISGWRRTASRSQSGGLRTRAELRGRWRAA